MINDPQITRMKKWLVKINIVAGVLFGALLQFLIATTFFYELPIIIILLLSIPVFIFWTFFGILLWKWTMGYILAFGVGMWWGHKTRND